MEKKLKKSRRMINVLAGVFIMTLVCTGAAYDVTGVDVTITEIDEIRNVENTITVRTKECSVGDIITSKNLGLGVHDKMNYDGYHVVEGGEDIVIRRGIGVTVEVDGTLVTMSATGDTVSDALVENGIFINELDYTVPALDSKIDEGLIIKIVRVDSNTELREEIIPFETIYKESSDMYEGTEKVITEGVNGKIKISESVVKEDGNEISRTEISREVLVEKVDKVISKGTRKKEKAVPAMKTEKKSGTTTENSKAKNADKINETKKSDDKSFSYSKKLTMTATAYSAFKKDGSYGKTASGMTAKYGVVAVDPKVIPLGTKLYVEGYGYAVAGDTGGVIKGNKIDLCFEKSNSELMAFGRKSVEVYILN